MHLMTGCYLITFCFPLWSYWKETITSHNYLQYCMCIAEYWIDIMSIEFGLTSAVIFQCIFHCLLKRNWEGGNSQSSLHSAELPLPFYISLPIFVLFSPLVRVTGSYLHITHILKASSSKVRYLAFTLTLWYGWACQISIYIWKH